MKLSKNDVRSSARSIPALRFESQALTSFSGAVLYQVLFSALCLRERLVRCVRHVESSSSYGLHRILELLILHLMLGWRRIRDLDYYRDDPLVKRVLGLKVLPTASTLTRSLRSMGGGVVERLRGLMGDLVLERVRNLSRVTVDFDGSVQSTKSRHTEGTAVGYNPKGKGQRSYYPLFATVAQTGQFLDVLHRPGNVHDSRGALAFIKAVFQKLSDSDVRGPREARLDGAHFSDECCGWLAEEGINFSISVPWERFPALKGKILGRSRWHRIDDTWSYFEFAWKPKKWGRTFRVIVYRQKLAKPRKGPIQLDLFEPISWEYQYKAVMTNKVEGAEAVLKFHNGRGSQEGLFAEVKSQCNMDYIPTRRLIPNQIYTLAALLAHNLNRELQMRVAPPARRTTPTRACLWIFEQIDTFRQRIIQRAGRFTRPSGQLTLTLSANKKTAKDLLQYLNTLQAA